MSMLVARNRDRPMGAGSLSAPSEFCGSARTLTIPTDRSSTADPRLAITDALAMMLAPDSVAAAATIPDGGVALERDDLRAIGQAEQ